MLKNGDTAPHIQIASAQTDLASRDSTFVQTGFWLRKEYRMKKTLVMTCIGLFLVAFAPFASGQAITITVQDLTTGQPITNGETLTATDTVQVWISMPTTSTLNCAGELIVTQSGPPTNPAPQVAQNYIYFLGPAYGFFNVGFTAFPTFVQSNGKEDYKVSASCDGEANGSFKFAHFEFHVKT